MEELKKEEMDYKLIDAYGPGCKRNCRRNRTG